MPSPITERAQLLEPFLAMEVMEHAQALERAGAKVAHLEVGEPDFPPPPEVVEACVKALREGHTSYTDSRGLFELREAIAADSQRRFGVAVSPERVLVTSGTSPAMLMVFSLLAGPGDEVVIGTPHYPCYPNFIRYCGATVVPVRTRAQDGWALDPEAVRAALTPRTRAIVVSSPANPTGAVQSAATLRALAELGPPLVSDEIYDGLLYDGAVSASALQAGGADSFVLDGFSKRYAMTGFRLGYVIAPEWAARPLQVMHQNLFISANGFVQRAGIAALEHGERSLAQMRSAYEQRRTRLVSGLRKLGFGIPQLPQGAFYVLADASFLGAIGRDSRRLAFELLDHAHVGVAPGIDFGEAGEGMLRFCYAVSDEVIDTALDSIARALPQLQDAPARAAGSGS
jgi:aspartate/methionine/tyrosine aminotransferase